MAKIISVLTFALFALVTSAAHAATIWEVEYFLRGDISQVTHFYGEGTYQFLLAPTYVTVYLIAPSTIYRADGSTYVAPTWVFQGYYGAAVLPEGFPLIAFPAGTDAAVVVPSFQPDTLPGPSIAVPEPPTWLLMVVMALMLGAILYSGRQTDAHEEGELMATVKRLVVMRLREIGPERIIPQPQADLKALSSGESIHSGRHSEPAPTPQGEAPARAAQRRRRVAGLRPESTSRR